MDKVKLSLEQVNDVAKGMPGGFFIYKADEDEDLIAYNDVVMNIYGCKTKAEFLMHTGGNFKGMVYPDDLKKVEKTIDDQIAIDDQNFDHVEYRIVKKDGEIAWVDDFGRLVDTEEYGPVYYVFIQDITEKRKIQSENLRMHMELEKEKQLKATRDEFLFNVSHDIRTPMNAIIGYTELSLKALDDRDELKENLTKVLESSHHMMSLIDDLLEMATICSEQVEVKSEVCNIKEELQQVIVMMEIRANESNVTLNSDINLPDINVITDAHRFRRIMNNIIENAIKFTPEGGSVDICAKAGEKSEAGYCRYMFDIADTGIGMSEDFLKKIFKAFEREETSTKSAETGAGLGLSIAKNLVDRLGGTITVRSKKDVGTTFTIELPMKAAEGPVKESLSSFDVEAKADGDYRILIVEDIDINRKLAEKVLGDAGFIVESVVDGSDAVDRMEKSPEGYYDLILMDIQMPVMNGYEATRMIRAIDRHDCRTMPIIALSANARQEDKNKSYESGMNAHIAKPFEIAGLIKTLNDYLNSYTR